MCIRVYSFFRSSPGSLSIQLAVFCGSRFLPVAIYHRINTILRGIKRGGKKSHETIYKQSKDCNICLVNMDGLHGSSFPGDSGSKESPETWRSFPPEERGQSWLG